MDIFLKDAYEKIIPAQYKSIIEQAVCFAKKNNIKIYLIGGVVRDLLLNNPFKDVDITVEADAIDYAKALENYSNCKIVSVQDNLKTAKIEFPNSIQIDFASTRKEKYSLPANLPLAYDFGCPLTEDVKRRDFTINTLAVELSGNDNYRLIDYCGGFQDLKNRKIRILHSKSFIDDPSRIIRALKFMLRLNFDIEIETLKLMKTYLNSFNDYIPLERVKNELFDYFQINNDDLYKYIIDYKVYKLFSNKPVLKFNTKALQQINCLDKSFILFSLLILNSDYENTKYNLTSKEKKILNEVKLLTDSQINPNNNFEIYKKFDGKSETALNIYSLICSDETLKIFEEKLKDIKVIITGDDLIKLGFKPSRYFSEIFDKILKEKINGNIMSKEDEIEYIRKESR